MTLAAAAWVDPLIAALAAIGGAIVGAGAVVWATVHAERGQRERERRDALVGFYGAALSFASLGSAWAEMQLKGPLAELRLGVRMIGLTGIIVGRLWTITDSFWQASARARAVAIADELSAIDAVESAIGEWTFGEPVPASFVPAIRRLRVLLERHGDTLPEAPEQASSATNGDTSAHTPPA